MDMDSFGLRKRFTSATRTNETLKSDWQIGGGAFYEYQINLKKKYPGLRFENECCDPDTNFTECSVTGFQGTTRELISNENECVTFLVEDGRIVVRFDPTGKRKPVDQQTIILGMWAITLIGTFIYTYFYFHAIKKIFTN